VTDCFALFDEPRRPWIDPEQFRQKFLALSAKFHPDRVHNAPEAERQAAERAFAELSAAHQCLREPAERLRHLLELELGEKPAGLERPAPEMADFFFEAGRLCREAEAFRAEKARVTSPVLQAGLFEHGLEWTERLMALQQKINARRDELAAELKTMNAAWESAPENESRRATLPLERLEELCRLSGYLARWSARVQEQIAQLSF
jgi:DnaJ-domain-containing protein 1